MQRDQRDRIAKVLGPHESLALAEQIKALEDIAIDEFFAMIVGDYHPQRLEDIRQYRMMLLIKYYFGNEIPRAVAVGRIFHLTTAQSRSLIRRTLATYQRELSDTIAGTAGQMALSARKDGDFHVLEADAEAVAVINENLALRDPLLPPIRRRPGTGGQFIMDAVTRTALHELGRTR
jgi:hypothetical protein